jgi:5'-nucleotidase
VRILLTNDDGIAAEGFAALRRIAAQLSDDVWAAAPEHEHSGASRKLTLSEPLRVRRVDERSWAVDGTPTDCVNLAIQELMEAPPDLVLSGVNWGQNLAEDTSLSGTVAGAIQGMELGVPSIALSQGMGANFERRGPDVFAMAERHAAGLIERLVEIGWPKDEVVINVNFPWTDPDSPTEVEVTRQGFRDQHNMHFERRKDLRGRDYFWLGFLQQPSNPAEGTDLRAVYEGRISVTPLHIDLTHRETVHALKGVLGGPPPRLSSTKA